MICDLHSQKRKYIQTLSPLGPAEVGSPSAGASPVSVSISSFESRSLSVSDKSSCNL